MRLRKSMVCLVLTGLLGLSGPVVAVDLLQVYHEALVNDAQYATARATAEAGREKLPQGLAGLLPARSGTRTGTMFPGSRASTGTTTPTAITSI
jgi:outer membrane protein